MSFTRVVYYSIVVGGWSGFLGWLISELLFLRANADSAGVVGLVLTGAIVGATIGAGINVLAGFSNTNLRVLVSRTASGLAIGAAGGALGLLSGNLLFVMFRAPRPFGYAVLGLCVGIADGLYERSGSKIRNGIIGGLIGGFIGGMVFDPLVKLLSSDSGVSSRATSFVILGMAVGGFIGLVQVALKEAWLTVLDGYRPGRQLILSRPVTTLGRAEHLQLPFIGAFNVELEPEHVRITRDPNGDYFVEDNRTKLGTMLNQQALSSRRLLANGDVIKFGKNFVRFNERRKSSASVGSPGPVEAANSRTAPITKAPPPPPQKPAVLNSPPKLAPPVVPPKQKGNSSAPAVPKPGPRLPPPPPPPPRKMSGS